LAIWIIFYFSTSYKYVQAPAIPCLKRNVVTSHLNKKQSFVHNVEQNWKLTARAPSVFLEEVVLVNPTSLCDMLKMNFVSFACFISVDEYNPTISEEYTKRVEVDGNMYTVTIQDTAGQEEFKALLPQAIRDCDCFVVVYDVQSMSSFGEIETHINRFNQVKVISPKLITIAGNKSDLESKVNPSYGKELCNKIGCNFTLVSAKKHEGIDEMFLNLVKEFHREKSKIVTVVKPEIKKDKGVFSSISQNQEDDLSHFKEISKK
jgi:small GTP-binding protein